jgi:hypothetical protein
MLNLRTKTSGTTLDKTHAPSPSPDPTSIIKLYTFLKDNHAVEYIWLGFLLEKYLGLLMKSRNLRP